MSVFQRQPNESSYYNKQENSTADKYYDLEQSQRRYQELVDENIWLKQQIERGKHLEVTEPTHCHHCTECSAKEPVASSSNGDIMLWNMLQRNRYLENKIGKLRGQYEKQAKTLSSIRSSEKWRNRNQCNPQGNSCYEDKYLQLLRIRSPFY